MPASTASEPAVNDGTFVTCSIPRKAASLKTQLVNLGMKNELVETNVVMIQVWTPGIQRETEVPERKVVACRIGEARTAKSKSLFVSDVCRACSWKVASVIPRLVKKVVPEANAVGGGNQTVCVRVATNGVGEALGGSAG